MVESFRNGLGGRLVKRLYHHPMLMFRLLLHLTLQID